LKSNEIINKDLILRENLAMERTDMAIDRTLLAFVRTSLYFAVAGMTINNLLKLSYGQYFEIGSWIIAVIILLIGILRFFQQKRNLKNNRIHIGNYQLYTQKDSED
jgi:putative membrane protein